VDRVRIIGVDITATNMDDCMTNIQENLGQARGKYICAANVHTTVMAHENAEYRNIQNQSYMTLPDGKPLSMVGKKRGFPSMGRVTGPGFMETVLSLSEQNGWTHYFYGNTDENIRILYNYLKKTYPKLNILGYEPSIFRPLSAAEKDELIERINECEPDFVWIGLGAPRQEQFCAELSGRTSAVWVGVGGAFNVVAGIIPRAPQWMQKCCLEWLYRLLKEPRRLLKRYVVTNTKFIYYLLKDKK